MALPTTTEKDLNIQVIAHDKLTWVYIEKPTQLEMDYLSKRYPFHPLNLDDCISVIQRPKIDEYADHLFLVLHFPIYDKQSRLTTPSEVDFFIGENYLVTVHCSANLRPLAKFFKDCQLDEPTRRENMGRNAGYLLYKVMDRLVDYCFPMLNKINANIEGLQDAVISKPLPATAEGILVIRRDTTSMRRIIRPQVAVVETLERNLKQRKYPFLPEDLDVYFGDIGDHLHKLWGALDDYKEIVDALSDTANWLTSHRIQEVMRVLTIFMSVLMVVEVIASMQGSNVLPQEWHDNKGIFFSLLAVQVAAVLALLFFFRRRHWI
ncbi:MAG: magnesium transporter CorA family protein [Chloroflexota bacterium]|nr:magnesium transporter CorA family protein [Chloroflexota bacterium]